MEKSRAFFWRTAIPTLGVIVGAWFDSFYPLHRRRYEWDRPALISLLISAGLLGFPGAWVYARAMEVLSKKWLPSGSLVAGQISAVICGLTSWLSVVLLKAVLTIPFPWLWVWFPEPLITGVCGFLAGQIVAMVFWRAENPDVTFQ